MQPLAGTKVQMHQFRELFARLGIDFLEGAEHLLSLTKKFLIDFRDLDLVLGLPLKVQKYMIRDPKTRK